MKNNELTLEEKNLLVCYILSTTQYRKKEAEAWDKLAEERKEDGMPLFTKAKSNADYYRELEDRLQAIINKLDNV